MRTSEKYSRWQLENVVLCGVVLQGYDSLLSIDDVEKKALAQPPENRSIVGFISAYAVLYSGSVC